MNDLAQAQNIKQYKNTRHFDEPFQDLTLIITELYNPVANEWEYYVHAQGYGSIKFIYGLEGPEFPKLINKDDLIAGIFNDAFINIDEFVKF